MTAHRFRAAPQAILCIAAFVAILPMLWNGPSFGHDFDFHLLSWLEASNQFAHGSYPHWAFTPAWNAGEPRFVFYPPLSWMLGGLLGLALPWNFVPAAFTWIALTLSGLTMHRLASRYASPSSALLAATLYLANPYMLFTAYERTAYGELLAAAWLPLLFAAALPLSSRSAAEGSASRSSPILRISIPLALIWLTNAPAAVMSSYALAFLITVRLIRPSLPSSLFPLPSRFRLALTATAGVALALGLAAFYIVPAAYEQRFVQVNMLITEGMRPADHFLFHHMSATAPDAAYHDQVVHTASLIALSLLALIFLAATIRVPHSSRLHRDEWDVQSRLPLLLLAILIAFLLTPPSLFLWTHIPKLAFLQFPWRLSALLAVIMATLVAQALDRFALPSSLLPLPLALLLVLPAWRAFHLACDPDDAVPARVALFQHNSGSEPTDEYTPLDADNDALRQNDPTFWLAPPAAPDTPASTLCKADCRVPLHLVLPELQPTLLVMNLRNFPTWNITVNGHSTPSQSARQDGLITIPLRAGTDTIDITYRRTPDQTIGLLISALASVTTLGLARKRLIAES